MKFYDREQEIGILRKNWELSATRSLFTVLMGSRRIGKTALLMKVEAEQNMLYLYVSKDNEHVLVEKFQKAAPPFPAISSLSGTGIMKNRK